MNDESTESFPEPKPFSPEAVDRARKVLDELPESVGPYRILERIGFGGMGEVFRAEQRVPIRRQVAIKLIKLGMDTKLVIARFEAERQALALMDHPHIAKVFDASTDENGRPYFVMEYIRGKPITNYADQNQLSIPERMELFKQVCHAVQHAHHKGIIHRDIKPSNVLTCSQDGKPHAKIIDFGIAKAISQQLTENTVFTLHNQFIGTPQYMSPEQAEGNVDIDTRTDVYSLGVMMYELLTGSTPFSNVELKAAAFDHIKRMICEIEPPKPSTRLSLSEPTLPSIAAMRRVEPKKLGTIVRGELDWIVMTALDKDRRRRYDTPNDLADDIERYLTGQSVEAAPPSQLYRLRKFARKNKGSVFTAAAIATSLAAGLGATTWQWQRANANLSRALKSEQQANAEREDAIKQRDAAQFEAYVANLSSAQGALEYDNYPEAREHLANCPKSLRNWEWDYLQEVSQSIVAVLRTNTDEEPNFTVRSNGNRVLAFSRSSDGSAQLYSSQGALIGSPIRFEKGERILSAKFSDDESRIAMAIEGNKNDAADYWIALFDADGNPVANTQKSNSVITSIAYCPKKNLLLSTSSDSTARLWDANGKPTGPVLQHSFGVDSAAFSPDGTWFITIASNPNPDPAFVYTFWDLRGKLLATIGPNSEPSSFMEFNQEGNLVLMNLDSNSAQVYDRMGNPVGNAIRHDQVLKFARFRPDSTVLTITPDGARVWSANGLLQEFDSQATNGLALLEGGQHLIAKDEQSSDSKQVSLYHLTTKERHYFDTNATAFSLAPDSKRLLAVGWSENELRDLSGRLLGTNSVLGNGFLIIPEGNVTIESVNYYRSKAGILKIDRFDEPKQNIDTPADPSLHQLPELVVCAMFAQEMDKLPEPATVQGINLIDYGWNGGTSHKNLDLRLNLEANSPDGTRRAVVDNKSIKIEDRNRQRLVARIKTSESIRDISFTPKGKRIVVKLENGSFQCFDARTYEERQSERDREFQKRTETTTYMDTLLASQCPNDLLLETIIDDSKLSLAQKSSLGSRLPMELEGITIKSNNLFKKISEGCLTLDEVRQGIKEQELANPQVATRYGLQSYLPSWIRELHDKTWQIILNPVGTEESYSLAIQNMLTAISATDADSDDILLYRNALGGGYYRVQQFEKSIEELESVMVACEMRKKEFYISGLAHLAMSNYKLGDKEAAAKYFDRMTVRRNKAGELANELIALLDEAKALIDP
jgi:serine/threonine protein kinase